MDENYQRDMRKSNDDFTSLIHTFKSDIPFDFVKPKELNQEYEERPLTERSANFQLSATEIPYANPEETKIDLSSIFLDPEPPKIEKAEEMRAQHLKFLNEKFCSIKHEEIGKLCLNYQMYLSIVMRICLLFLIIGLLSIYPIYYNSQGSRLRVGDAYFEIDLWNLNNQDPPADLDEYSKQQRRIKNFMAVDFLTILVYFFYLQYLANFIKKITIKHSERSFDLKRYDEDTIDIEDYTIMVLGLPYNTNENEIKEKFETEEVVKVILVKDYENGLNIYKRINELNSEKEYLIKLCPRLKNDIYEKRLKIIDNKLESLKEKQKKFHSVKCRIKFENRFPIIRAFIVFSTKEERNNWLAKYSPFVNLLSIFNIQHESLRLKSTSNGIEENIKIKVFAADSPNSINWEHIKHHRSLICQFIIFIICFFLILGTSYEIVFIVKKYFSKLISNRKCSEIDSGLPLLDAQRLYSEPSEKYCYCKNQLFSEMRNNNDLKDYCSDFLEDMTITIAIRFTLGIVVWFVNFGMKKSIKHLIGTVYHSGKNKGELLILTCLFPLVVINMGVVTIVLNVDEAVFTKEWFNSSGSTLVSAMLVGILTSHLEYIISFLLGYYKRTFRLKQCISQGEMNKRFKGSDFELANRYALMLIVVCICYMHAGGLPTLNIICCLSLFVQYFVDKWLMFKHCSTPVISNKFIGHRVILLLHFPLLIHCIEFFFIYHSTLINNQDVLKPENPQESFKLPIGVSVVTSIITILSLLKHFFKLKLCFCKRVSSKVQTSKTISKEFLIQLAEKYDIAVNSYYSKFINDIKYENFMNSQSIGLNAGMV
ncbi:hypothetical protein SteCoe_29273 [Stentor coeruleus]|uniref:CSC1/OSCA1-like cytosolic domain-containing protein n=1 Tax=Stentor coeruleus TaxID=5963 RepID=A0A1R2B6D7_9CILI|nr:hypothetical protein SteCoe_29273 [Stentor coeruleus]